MELILGFAGGAACLGVFLAGVCWGRRVGGAAESRPSLQPEPAEGEAAAEQAEREAFRALLSYNSAVAYGQRPFGGEQS